ncbi:MAG: SAVED domain-containing protein [Kofleriaceae bacterium]
MRREVPIIILVDLSPRAMEESEVVERIPDRPFRTKVLRVSQHFKVSRGDGSPETPAEWAACASGVITLAQQASAAAAKIARSGDVARLWIAGTAGLPVFFHLGYALSSWSSSVTILHREHDGTCRSFALDQAASGGYFDAPVEEVVPMAAGGPGLVVSVVKQVLRAQLEEYQNRVDERISPVTTLHTNAWLTEETFGAAAREIAAAVRGLPSKSATIFLRCPTPLAFVAGRSVNPNVVPRIRIPEFRAAAYCPAIELPVKHVVASVPTTRRTLLFLAANPHGSAQLAVKREGKTIHQAVRDAKRGRGRIRFVTKTNVDPDELVEHLNQYDPDIVHFSGHGRAGSLSLETDIGAKVLITPATFARVLARETRRPIKAVYLNACKSKDFVADLLPHVSCVVTNSDVIDDDAAREFSTVFYRDLTLGRTFREAFEGAKDRLVMKDIPDHEIVTITFAPGVDPETLAL